MSVTATKNPICSGFVLQKEPSDGLEPSTPSLPWRLGELQALAAEGALRADIPAFRRTERLRFSPLDPP